MPNIFLIIALLTAATFAQQGSFADLRDGKTYKTTKIGTQTWLAENLSYNAEGSVCYENKPKNCEKYGRLYDWNTAMKACPKGWHLPDTSEWSILIKAVGGKETAGKHLKAKLPDWDGTDNYSFSAIPSGDRYWDITGEFLDLDTLSYWWTATQSDDYTSLESRAYARIMSTGTTGISEYGFIRGNGFSVRCIKDN
jgi:uncharacterized protein (TIGR02145 family)